MRPAALLNPVLLFAAAWLVSSPALSAVVIEGSLYNGPASTAKLRTEGFGSPAWKMPVASHAIEIRSLKHEAVKSWKASTGPQGFFRIETDLPNAADGAPFVAMVNIEGRLFYSGSFGVEPGKKLEIFAYPAGDDPSRVRTITKLVHTMEKEGDLPYLKVQCSVEFWNGGDALFVGSKNKGGGPEVYRLPVPAGAVIIRNKGVAPGTKWKKTADGKFLVIDEPIPGLADLVAARQQPGTKGWLIEYRVPASAAFIMTYPLALAPMTRSEGQVDGFLVFTQEGDMNIEIVNDDPLSGVTRSRFEALLELDRKVAAGEEGPQERAPFLESIYKSLRKDLVKTPSISKLVKFNNPVKNNPVDGAAESYAVYGPRPDAVLAAGSTMVVPIEISHMAIGQVSEKALLWHGGTIAVILLAILSGLALSRSRGGSGAYAEIMADDNLDTLDKIARLDQLGSTGSIGPKEYQRQREVLIEIAAGELEKGSALKKSPPPRQAVPAATRGLLDRLQELESNAGGGVEEARERAHLLESLYKSMQADLGG